MQNQIFSCRSTCPTTADEVGGKGHSLALLKQAGENVPAFFVLSTRLVEKVFEDAGLWELIDNHLSGLTQASPNDEISAAAQAVQSAVAGLVLHESHRQAIAEAVDEHFPADTALAVRSSAADEDAEDASFAGLHDSFLFVKGADDVLEKVKRVWASAFNVRAIAFRLQAGLPVNRIRTAVVVQEMVEPVASGVMFTVNATSGNVKEVMISSLWGVGEGLVSAGLAADLFVCGKDDKNCTDKSIARKTEQYVQDGRSGVKCVSVPAEKQETPSLSDDLVRELVTAGSRIEAFYKRPQDIEFAVDARQRLYILQSRPVTTAAEYGPAAGNRIIWDNSNIIESYSGPTSPMTFSFIRHAYTIVYHCFAEVMGVPQEVVSKNRHVFENMLGLFNGQVYYNLLNWYRLVKLFPGFSYNKGFMESMMGVKDVVEVDDSDDERPGVLRRYCVELPKLFALAGRSVWNFMKIEKLVQGFETRFRKHYGEWAQLNFNDMSPYELMQTYRDMEDKLLWNWKAPIINDFCVMVFYGSLKRRCMNWCGDQSGTLQNDLICGEGDIESTKPTKLLMEIARMIRSDDRLRQKFAQATPAELAETVPSDPACREVHAKIQYYLESYGFRCINELKLEEPSLRETPEFLYQMIQNYLSMQDPRALDPAVMEAREHEIRTKAEAEAFQHLDRAFSLVPRKTLFRWILNNARRGVRNRENMRFARTRIYGMLRELLNAVGKHFQHEHILEQWEDIYYLTIDEVWDFVKGTAVSTNLKTLAAVRKEEYAQYNAPDAPVLDDHFETYGLPYHRNLYKNWDARSAEDTGTGDLQGIGCSPGRLTGTVRVVKSPKEDLELNGEILATSRTDPGWVPLYPAVSGILIERGSILSHSAIVARELGIPTIVGIPDLLQRIEDGQTVEMDGSTGSVKVQDN